MKQHGGARLFSYLAIPGWQLNRARDKGGQTVNLTAQKKAGYHQRYPAFFCAVREGGVLLRNHV